MAGRYFEKYSMYSTVREMCFKITSIPVRIGIIRKIITGPAGVDVGTQIYELLQEANEGSLLEISQKPYRTPIRSNSITSVLHPKNLISYYRES